MNKMVGYERGIAGGKGREGREEVRRGGGGVKSLVGGEGERNFWSRTQKPYPASAARDGAFSI